MSFPARLLPIQVTVPDGTVVHLSPQSVEFVVDGSQCSPPELTRVVLNRAAGDLTSSADTPTCPYFDVLETAEEVLTMLRRDETVERMARLRAIRERFPALEDYPERDVALIYENLWALNRTIARQIVAGGSLLTQCMRQRDPASPDGLWIAPDLALALMKVRGRA